MSIIQSAWAKGTRQIARPQTANAVHVQVFEYDFSKGEVDTTDILEIGAIPAYARVVDANLYASAALTGVAVGTMSGEFGSTDSARTASDNLFASGNVTATGVTRLSLSELLKRIPTDKDVGLGVTVGAKASSGKLYLELFFVL